MYLRYVSLTGADNNTAISSLESLQEQYPMLEVAILYFPERDGLQRNPPLAWREKFYDSKINQKALHLCGSGINKFAEGDSQLLSEINEFDRVQINLKPQYASVELVEKLVSQVKKFSYIEFMTQYNDVNQNYFKYWTEVENHTYLFDASLGKGLAPENWQAPVFGKSCGYAGGLSPDNIVENLVKINQVAGNTPIWIDMESGVRTQDEFDLVKCQKVLEATQNFLKTN